MDGLFSWEESLLAYFSSYEKAGTYRHIGTSQSGYPAITDALPCICNDGSQMIVAYSFRDTLFSTNAEKTMPASYKHIEGLNPNDIKASDALATAKTQWIEARDALPQGSDKLVQLQERLARSWSIETGVIEGIYTLTKGTTTTLVEHGFKAGLVAHGESNLSEEELYAILKDQTDALDWVFEFVKSERSLSVFFIKELHALLTKHQEHITVQTPDGRTEKRPFLLKGTWKEQPNNPKQPDGTIFHYCPPEQVQQEMDNLVAWYKQYAEGSEDAAPVTPEVLAAWLHHRFVLIHPFQDGNGRVARALASLVFIKANLFPLTVPRENRNEYIDALKAADEGNLQVLVNFFAELQIQLVYEGTDIANEVFIEAQDISGNYADSLKMKEFAAGRASVINKISLQVAEYAQTLLTPYANSIDKQIKLINDNYESFTYVSSDNERILLTAFKELTNKRIDIQTFADHGFFTCLCVKEDKTENIVFSFISSNNTTLEFKSISVIWREQIINKMLFGLDGFKERKITQYTNGAIITNMPFVFTATEPLDDIKIRFEEWFSRAIKLAQAALTKRLSL